MASYDVASNILPGPMAWVLPAGIGDGVSAGGTRYTSFVALYLAAGTFTAFPSWPLKYHNEYLADAQAKNIPKDA